jgi:hypothetical protein
MSISNIVLVHSSIYGNDKFFLLDARGAVTFDVASTSPSQLHKWHGMGPRGIRVDLQSNDKSLTDSLRTDPRLIHSTRIPVFGGSPKKEAPS